MIKNFFSRFGYVMVSEHTAQPNISLRPEERSGLRPYRGFDGRFWRGERPPLGAHESGLTPVMEMIDLTNARFSDRILCLRSVTEVEEEDYLCEGFNFSGLDLGVISPLSGNYSMIYHEIINGSTPALVGFRTRLNSSGLFSHISDAMEFLKLRLAISDYDLINAAPGNLVQVFEIYEWSPQTTN